MKINFSEVEEKITPHFNGGEGEFIAKKRR